MTEAGPPGPAPFLDDVADAARPARCEFLRARGARIRAAFWEGGDRGLALLLPGRTEYLEKYVRVVASLTARGFAVASLDWRGQGLSDRAPGARGLGHVDDFADFQDDLRALLDWAPVARAPGPRLLAAHSMGGCIGLRALISGLIRPAGAIFSAPMWGLAGPAPLLAAVRIGGAAARMAGLGMRAMPGRGGALTYVLGSRFAGNALTTDREHWDWFVRQAREHPELTLGAPTIGWVSAALAETAALRHASSSDCAQLVLLGSDEAVVSVEAIRARAARTPSADLAPIEGGRHEVLMEAPGTPVAGAVRSAVDEWLAASGL